MAGWGLRLVAGLLLLALPWPGLAAGFAAGYAAVVDRLLLDHIGFGQGGHAQLRAADAAEKRAADNVIPDAVIALGVDGYAGELKVTMSLRRDAYLPICVLGLVVLCAPLPLRRRLRALAVGLPAIVVLTIVCQWFGILWLFANRLSKVMALGPRAASLVDGVYQVLLLPPANRFLVPLLLGIGLVWWQLVQVQPAQATLPRAQPVPPPAPVPDAHP